MSEYLNDQELHQLTWREMLITPALTRNIIKKKVVCGTSERLETYLGASMTIGMPECMGKEKKCTSGLVY